MVPEQVGAHRAPKPHVTWNLWGENITNSSDSDNIIAVYHGVSFLEGDFPEPSLAPPTSDEVIEVSSCEDFSNLVDTNGYALKDIKVTNDTLNIFVFIPKGTKILDRGMPLTKITIKPSEIQPDYSNLIPAGEMLYQLEPDGAVFDPYIIIDLPFDTSNTGTPMICRYNTTIWDSLSGTVSRDRISTNLTQFSVYGVFVEAKYTSPEISMSAIIKPAISIEVTPDKLDFGKLAPGDTSEISDITINNYGSCKILVTANVAETGDLYKQGLDIDENSLELFNLTVDKNMLKTPYVALHVLENYKGVGNKTGTLMFWAEGVN